jgi:hypothetical protein
MQQRRYGPRMDFFKKLMLIGYAFRIMLKSAMPIEWRTHWMRGIAAGFVLRGGIWRLVALVASLLWCTALFEPIRAVRVSAGAPWFIPLDSLRLALFGWLGPIFFLAPGWYANIPFAISLYRCFGGRVPGRRPAVIGLLFAATALIPFMVYDFWWGLEWYVLRGPAVWLWLGAYALVWIPAILADRLPLSQGWIMYAVFI